MRLDKCTLHNWQRKSVRMLLWLADAKVFSRRLQGRYRRVVWADLYIFVMATLILGENFLGGAEPRVAPFQVRLGDLCELESP